METQPTPLPRKRPDWAVLTLIALLIGGLLFVLYNLIASQNFVNRQMGLQNMDLHKRLGKMEAVEETNVKSSMLDELKQTISENEATIATLTARLDTVEKTTSAPAPNISFTAPAAGEKETLQQFIALRMSVEQGQPFAAELGLASALPEVTDIAEQLRPHAEKGVATETDLRDTLDGILEAHPATVTVEDPKLEAFNSKLKGLLTVRRKQPAAVDDYAALRAQSEAEATLDILVTSVRDLPEAAGKPLAEWLAQATARQSALTALKAAEMAILKPKQ